MIYCLRLEITRAGECEDARRRGIELERECAALRAENAALARRCEAADARHAALQRDFQAVMLESVRLARLAATRGEEPAPAPAPAAAVAALADLPCVGHPAAEAPPPPPRAAAPLQSAGYGERLFQRTLREFQAACSESSWEAASEGAASERASACSTVGPAASTAGQGSSFFGIPWGDVQRQLAALRSGAPIAAGPDSSEDENQSESDDLSEEEARADAGDRGGRAGVAGEHGSASRASRPGGGTPSSARSNSWGCGAPSAGPRGRGLRMRYRHALTAMQRTSGPGTPAALERGRSAAPGQGGGASKENVAPTPFKGANSDAGRPWKPPGRAALRTALPGNARIQGPAWTGPEGGERGGAPGILEPAVILY